MIQVRIPGNSAGKLPQAPGICIVRVTTGTRAEGSYEGLEQYPKHGLWCLSQKKHSGLNPLS